MPGTKIHPKADLVNIEQYYIFTVVYSHLNLIILREIQTTVKLQCTCKFHCKCLSVGFSVYFNVNVSVTSDVSVCLYHLLNLVLILGLILVLLRMLVCVCIIFRYINILSIVIRAQSPIFVSSNIALCTISNPTLVQSMTRCLTET